MVFYDNPLEFCTYLTTYSGDKMPPYYIGSTNYERFLVGYHGSVTSKEFKKIWKLELKQNPHLFYTEILTFHNDRLEALNREREMQLEFGIPRNPLFINRALATTNGFFGRNVAGKDNPMFGTSALKIWKEELSPEEYKKRLKELSKLRSEISKGENNPMFGKKGELAPCFGRTGEKHPMFGKHGEDNPNTGKKWFTNEIINRFVTLEEGEILCSQGFRIGQKKNEKPKKKPKTPDLKFCPHCEMKSTNMGLLSRYHFDNCKMKS